VLAERFGDVAQGVSHVRDEGRTVQLRRR
jgi:hypothetical protein